MKTKIITFLLFTLLSITALTGKVAPLTEKVWSNSEFIKKYLGSFAISSEVEPKIGRAEQVLFDDITEMIDDNRTDEVIEELKADINKSKKVNVEVTVGDEEVKKKESKELNPK